MNWVRAVRYGAGIVGIGIWTLLVLYATGFTTSSYDPARVEYRIPVAWMPGDSVVRAISSGTVIEVVLNVIMFAPLGVLCSAFFGAGLKFTSAIAFLGSVAIEVSQFMFLTNRVTALDDVLLNTIGAILGWLLVALAFAGFRQVRYSKSSRTSRRGHGIRPLDTTHEPPAGDP